MICPHCSEEAGSIRVGEDDFIDFCRDCGKVIEGNTEEEK